MHEWLVNTEKPAGYTCPSWCVGQLTHCFFPFADCCVEGWTGGVRLCSLTFRASFLAALLSDAGASGSLPSDVALTGDTTPLRFFPPRRLLLFERL